MPKWTREQLSAINESGKNIIVSAGAGSGKTAVLTERVITKLKSGINIQNLLILTFTNAAASEMKNRIRSAISEIDELKSQVELVDSSYITTFDSFSMSVVKKYHYLLNVPSSINIIDNSVCSSIKNKYLDEIFEDRYKNKEEDFCKLIRDFTIKDDKSIKKSILKISDKIDKLINKREYLDNYIDNYYNEDNINKLYSIYLDSVINRINDIKNDVLDLYNYVNLEYYNKVYSSLNSLFSSKSYEEVINNISVTLPRIPSGSGEEVRDIKKKISDKIKNLNEELIYKDSEHIKNTLYNTCDYVKAIISIINELDSKMNEYKREYDVYEFNDIAFMAIDVVSKNTDVRNELMNNFKEIMVDEYQDTSDIQEEFISLISNNNVYMVGDVKQSIYRFRNANPDIFKNKYDKYSNNDGGIKIDLLNNFRSRNEVLDDINNIFDYIMDDKIGGALYKKSHRMIFGNSDYTLNHGECNYNLEVLNYNRDNKRYSESEYEAFIISDDIKNKIKNNYQIYDRGLKKLRSVQYKDFCILIDRKSKFELYKKIFEYSGVPLMIFYDENIKEERDVLIIRNIIDLIIKIKNKCFDTKFKYDMYSVCRSYLCDISDEEFINMYNNNGYYDSVVYKKCFDISLKLDYLSNKGIIDEIVSSFDMYNRVMLVGDVDKFSTRIDYLRNLADNLSSLGKSVYSFSEYLNELSNLDGDITISESVRECDNVKLMNIHKSKGLEFPICYFAGFSSDFNRDDIKESFTFDNKYGFIVPFYDDGIGNTIVHSLFSDKYILEDVSERIRLLYVALTRAREKMIIVGDFNLEGTSISDNVRSKYKSFSDIIYSIKDIIYDKFVNVSEVNVTKEYNNKKKISSINTGSDKIDDVKDFSVSNNIVVNSRASKSVNHLFTKDEVKAMKYGTLVHRKLEVSDFNNSKDDVINNLVSLLGNIDGNIYKEYEFISEKDGTRYHGIIDLMIEYNDYIKIIDYKLKNIEDEEYKKQLKIYREYIESKTNKKVYTYLYSIRDNKLLEIM